MNKIKVAIFEYTNLNIQIVKFLIVGGFTFTIDYLTMILLTEMFDANYLLSAGIGFIIGSTVNYLLSVKLVFVNGKYSAKEMEIFLFMVFLGLGLSLNQLTIYMGSDLFNIDYRVVKIGSLMIVTIFNFLTKKIFVFKIKEYIK